MCNSLNPHKIIWNPKRGKDLSDLIIPRYIDNFKKPLVLMAENETYKQHKKE
jgi:hypothetical protein